MIAKPVATAGTCGTTNASAPAPIVENSSGHRRLITVRAGLTSGSEVCVRALASSDAICDVVPARRPIQVPNAPATNHQPAETGTSRSSLVPAAAATVTAASALAAAALISTVVRRKSENRTPAARVPESVRGQDREEFGDALGPVDHDVGLLGDLGRPLLGAHAHADRLRDPALLGERNQGVEGVQVGR